MILKHHGLVVIVLVSASLMACTKPHGPSRAATTGAVASASSPASALADESAVVKADASTAPVQSALQALALNTAKTPTYRLSCLRKLEEVGSGGAVPTAEQLALDASRSSSGDFLRRNATAVLCRISSSGSPFAAQARSALAKVRASSLEGAILVERLVRNTGGK
jgi:hypothetical protein